MFRVLPASTPQTSKQYRRLNTHARTHTNCVLIVTTVITLQSCRNVTQISGLRRWTGFHKLSQAHHLLLEARSTNLNSLTETSLRLIGYDWLLQFFLSQLLCQKYKQHYSQPLAQNMNMKKKIPFQTKYRPAHCIKYTKRHARTHNAFTIPCATRIINSWTAIKIVWYITWRLTGSTSQRREISVWPALEPQAERPKYIPIHKVCLRRHATLRRPWTQHS